MKKLFLTLLICLFSVSISFAQGAKSKKSKIVDITEAQNRIKELTEENNKLKSDNDKMKAKNDESKRNIDKNNKTMNKIDGLLKKVGEEAETLKKQSRLVVDKSSHSIASQAYYNNEQTRQRLSKLKKDLFNVNQGHVIYTKSRSDNIAANNEKIKKNQDDISLLNASISQSQKLKDNIKNHAKTTDQLKAETDSLYKIHESGSEKSTTATTKNTTTIGRIK